MSAREIRVVAARMDVSDQRGFYPTSSALSAMALARKIRASSSAWAIRAQEPLAEFLSPALAFEILACPGCDLVH
jgi:hypothetical protein